MEAGKKRLAGDIVRQANTGEVTDLRRAARDLKEVVAEQTLELRLLIEVPFRVKKHARGWGGPRLRYPASEKLEIIRLVERSHLPAKQTLHMLGIARTTFYRWYAHYRLDGEVALQDKAPLPARVWNRIPDTVRELSVPSPALLQ
jgi:putative transposase